jgi:hypothetical protein
MREIEEIRPARFYSSFNDLEEHELLFRIKVGLERMSGSLEEIEQEVLRLPEQVYNFWRNGDHGLQHSQNVRERALAVLQSCPDMLRLCRMIGIGQIEANALINWASILHDFARFTIYDSLAVHQTAGANLARYCFRGETSDHVIATLFNMLVRHDYISELTDGQPLPELFINNPLAEIFRLADKTSITPVAEIERYHATGKRYPNPFFNPELTDEERFSFAGDRSNWDDFQYFLLFFAIQPSNWFFGETRDLYREWQEKCEGGKSKACARLIELAAAEELTKEQNLQIYVILDRFFKKFKLPNYVG